MCCSFGFHRYPHTGDTGMCMYVHTCVLSPSSLHKFKNLKLKGKSKKVLHNLKALSIFLCICDIYICCVYKVFFLVCVCTCLHAEAGEGPVSISSLLPVSFASGPLTGSGAGLVASNHVILWSPTSRALGLRAYMWPQFLRWVLRTRPYVSILCSKHSYPWTHLPSHSIFWGNTCSLLTSICAYSHASRMRFLIAP